MIADTCSAAKQRNRDRRRGLPGHPAEPQSGCAHRLRLVTHGISAALALLVLAAPGCGTRKNEDLETRKKQEALERDKDAPPLVIAGQEPSLDAVAAAGSCSLELARSSVFQPGTETKEGSVTVVFQGQMEEHCIKGAPDVHFYSDGALTLPGATCRPQAGAFNLKCTGGNIVKHLGSGKVELRLDGSKPPAQLDSLRVKVVYAE